MSNKREKGVEERKRRIFDATRAIIARDGLDGLTTRGLAEAAGLTVPTLYNLVGDKNAIISQTVERSVEAVWERLEFNRRATPLDMADAVIDEAYASICGDRAFQRALLSALDRMGTSFAAHPGRGDIGARAANRSVEMAVFACRAAQRRGLIRGNVPAEELGQQMFIAYRGPLRDWIEEVIGADEMLRRQRRGFYLVLAADASDAFRTELIERIAALSAQQANEEAA
ncbi:MAG: TetR/AcrR family transcriptional regulator [Erythrobacter sp.]|nr:TetR/AcrR family transcriptional regulator [Erythrobacter sp.]